MALLDAPAGGRNGAESRVGRGGRPAPSTPPARMWQIHVRAGVVSIDRGFWIDCGKWRESQAQTIGQASGGELVVAKPRGAVLSISLVSSSNLPAPPFRVIGRIVGSNGDLHVEQYESSPLAFDATDYPWRVTAEPNGSGGATLSMADGALVVDTASGPSMLTGISLGSTYGNISTGGYVIVCYNTSGSAATASFGASIPANTSNYNYLPVAKITKTGNDYAVEQYLAGAFFAYVAVDEEV